MPFFKSTYNILKIVDEDELWEDRRVEVDRQWIPPTVDWDYQREMKIEDVDIWEVIVEGSNGLGVYAAHTPYAEFYMVTTGVDLTNRQRVINGKPYDDKLIETFYGQGAQARAYKLALELKLPISLHKTWVDDDKLWLFTEPKPEERSPEKLIIIP